MRNSKSLIIGLVVFPLIAAGLIPASVHFFNLPPIQLQELDKVSGTVVSREPIGDPENPSKTVIAIYLDRKGSPWSVHYIYRGKARKEVLMRDLNIGQQATVYFTNRPGPAKQIFQLEAGSKVLVPVKDMDDGGKILGWVCLVMCAACGLATYLQYRSYVKYRRWERED